MTRPRDIDPYEADIRSMLLTVSSLSVTQIDDIIDALEPVVGKIINDSWADGHFEARAGLE